MFAGTVVEADFQRDGFTTAKFPDAARDFVVQIEIRRGNDRLVVHRCVLDPVHGERDGVGVVEEAGVEVENAAVLDEGQGVDGVVFGLLLAFFPVGDVELPLFEQGIGDDAVHFGVDLRRDKGLRGGNAADFVEPGARGMRAGFAI